MKNCWLKASPNTGALMLVALLILTGSAYGQDMKDVTVREATNSQTNDPQGTGTVIITGSLTNEKCTALTGQTIKFVALDPDCDCDKPDCKYKTCIECCSRGLGVDVVDRKGEYAVSFKLPPGNKYEFARVVGDSYLIFRSEAVGVKFGKTRKVEYGPFVDFATLSQGMTLRCDKNWEKYEPEQR